MPYSFTLTATIPASPQDIYEAWLDSVGHSQMTGGAAQMSDQIGAEISAWDGYISGRNLELVPGERIVQSWRTSEFGDAHRDSTITVILQSLGDGTLLTLEHSNVPEEHRSYEEGGWQSNYFEPMAAYFTERRQKSERSAPKKDRAKTAPTRKRPARAPLKRAAASAKASPRRKKKKAARKVSASRKATKPRVRKARRGKRR